LLGSDVNFKDAAEPTDIIWENRHNTQIVRVKRTIIVILCVFFLLFLSFCIIYTCSSYSSKSSLKYTTTDCADLYTDYGTQAVFEEYAFREYFANRDPSDWETELTDYDYGSIIKCFCSGKSASGAGMSDTYNNTLENMGELGKGYALCSTYFYDYYFALFFSSAMSVAIVVINTILKIIMIKLIKYIGEDTHSA
jgi:hypothetical protein